MITLLMLIGLTTAQLTCVTIKNSDGSCVQCLPGYYLNVVCLKCSMIGCSQCSNAAACTTCSQNYTLVGDTCYYCDSTYYYNNSTKNCQKCSANCVRCTNNTACIQCQTGYFLNDSLLCQNTTTPTASSPPAVWQSYLLYLMPDLRQPIHNSQDLAYACHNNGYVCRCANNLTTSRCKAYITSAVTTSYNILNNIVNASNTTNFPALCLASEPMYYTGIISKLYDVVDGLTPSVIDVIQLLQAVTKVSNINQLNQFTPFKMLISKITTKIGVAAGNTYRLQGNGFLFKISNLLNSNICQHPAFNTTFTNNQTGTITQMILFNRSAQSQEFTGILFEDGSLISQQRTISMPRLASLAETAAGFQLQDVTNGAANRTESVTSQNNILSFTIKDAATGVFKIAAKPVLPKVIYDTSRIENLFYKPSIFYILFFLALYIIFVPVCVFVDFIDRDKATKHKRVTGREVTQQELRGPSPAESLPSEADTEITVPITYKQFHPIYNIGATPSRPERLAKLSLYLLNLQHTLTFLIIFYGILPKDSSKPNSGVMAIGLVVPAYIINILLNYGFGFIKNKLPGNFKFLINIVPILYWILWYFLLQRITEDTHPYYQSYLIIFVIVCAFLDQVFDMLQMMIMYFVLKEDNGQYNCLAKILSMRGYFEYDKYAA